MLENEVVESGGENCVHKFCRHQETVAGCYLAWSVRLRLSALETETLKWWKREKLEELIETVRTAGEENNCPWGWNTLGPAIEEIARLESELK